MLRTGMMMMIFFLGILPASGQLPGELLKKPDHWYKSKEAVLIADNILLFQRYDGGWPKEWPHKKDYLKEYTAREKEKLYGRKSKRDATFDNGATWKELRFLAKAGNATGKAAYRLAFHQGLDFVLKAQYPNGGWPQFYPGLERYSPGFSKWSPEGIERFITYNDDAMTQVIWLLKDVAGNKEDFGFVNGSRREKTADAVKRGVDCILKSQVVYDGKPTAWPAQVDEVTLAPRWGRDFEPASIATAESVTIIRFLMNIEKPRPEVIDAIQGAVSWLEGVGIQNKRVLKKEETVTIGGKERREVYVEHDPEAPLVWARFYELNTFRPMFGDRGDVIRYDLSEVSLERRTGYSWYGTWPQKLLSTEYPEWCEKHHVENIQAKK